MVYMYGGSSDISRKIINDGDYRMEDNIQKSFFLFKRIVQKQKMANRCAWNIWFAVSVILHVPEFTNCPQKMKHPLIFFITSVVTIRMDHKNRIFNWGKGSPIITPKPLPLDHPNKIKKKKTPMEEKWSPPNSLDIIEMKMWICMINWPPSSKKSDVLDT